MNKLYLKFKAYTYCILNNYCLLRHIILFYNKAIDPYTLKKKYQLNQIKAISENHKSIISYSISVFVCSVVVV